MSVIFPGPFYCLISWGLSTGMAPEPERSYPIKGLLKDLAATMKCMSLGTACMRS